MNRISEDQTESEAVILDKVINLDEETLGTVHDMYFPKIYRYAYLRTGNASVAEDIASETFLRLLDAIKQGRPPHTTLRGWLFGVAAHMVIDHYNGKKFSELSETEPAQSSTQGEAEYRIQRTEVQMAISDLTVEQQEVLGLRFYSGLSLEETAAHMNRSITAVKAVQFRAIDALRQRLAEVENG